MIASFIYVIGTHVNNVVKIGYAASPTRRLAELQASSPLQLQLLVTLPGGRAEERQLHLRFARLRRHGEWFDFGDDSGIEPVVSAWLEIVRPETIVNTALVLSPAEELLTAVRDCFGESEDFLPTSVLLSRVMDYPGSRWWRGAWNGTRAGQMGLARTLALFDVHHVRCRRPNGPAERGYMRQDVHTDLRKAG